MRNSEIKVGYLVSYDYEYMKNSLPTVYEYADIIAVAIDKDRMTWKGTNYEIADSFFEWLKEYDKDNKIRIYEDSFFDPDLTVMENDTRERNMLGRFMGEGGWHIQVDSDEYFLDFKKFTDYLKSLDMIVATSVFARWVTIFKLDTENAFIIDNGEKFPVATNFVSYDNARLSFNAKKEINSEFKVIHQSWGRSEDELRQKLSNWGHSNDFDIESYFRLWKAIDKHTYKYITNFHPLNGFDWQKLECIEAKDIPTLIEKVRIIQEEKAGRKKNKWKSLFRRKK
ncbi:hypothetical protein GGR21_001795 [Dysgonomonas hofstadii]|uniref:Glycosyl transferase family 2 n=1 Tax=Dysgonomonas hofstadii TaxID=637886 RepID=A0A840CIW4_9BACT|nr:hypothetical protein [Dysgonomonas hofstadii]MBB4035900.1 hypothetical protein [Dysgonomonas hofstadii]